MKATIFDGTTVKPYDPGDAQALSTSSPAVWIAAGVPGIRDRRVRARRKAGGGGAVGGAGSAR
ncbi:MAG: hypothetical protein ACKOFP_03330, partial [Actinomycetota bacterium]